ncbi:MAG: hypothetical protein QY326_01865 [Bdellovibrionota bacterium]|nr:MAG: hypothetical protein QY326_01865 [Bdellovibrionota bacterium]
MDDALRLVADLVAFYNNERLHSAIGYIALVDKLNGKAEEIFNARDNKLEAARAARKLQRPALMPAAVAFNNCSVTNLAAVP